MDSPDRSFERVLSATDILGFHTLLSPSPYSEVKGPVSPTSIFVRSVLKIMPRLLFMNSRGRNPSFSSSANWNRALIEPNDQVVRK